MPSTSQRDNDAVEAAHPAATAPEPPHTIFDKRQKWLIVFIASFAATFSGFASNIYFPALPTIATDLNVSIELVNLTVTSYLILQGIAPSFWGPVSDVRGRRVAYLCTFAVFLGACVGLALTRNYATLIVLRCLQSAGSASTIAIGAGVIGDITTRAERGGFMGVYQGGLLVPVAVGPILGGAIAGTLGWRAIFWFLVIYNGVFLVLLVLLLPETLRSLVGNGSVPPPPSSLSWLTAFPLSVYKKTTRVAWEAGDVPYPSAERLPPAKKVDVLGPLRILACKFATPIVAFLAVYYAVWQMSITAMSSLFKDRYGLSEMHIGLTFIANGVGSMMGTFITGRILDADYARVKAKLQTNTATAAAAAASPSSPSSTDDDSFPIEKARLRLVPIFSLVQCISILLFGWTIQYPRQVPLAVPIISTFFTGWTAISTHSVATTYLVDVFPDRSAAASASLNIARCLCAAAGTSFVMPMIHRIGVGWTFTVCAGVQLLALAAVFVQFRFAPRWRLEAAQKNEASEAKD